MHNNDINGGELTDIPNDKYKKFFARFIEIETLPISEWKPVHLIGYFCKLYENQYHIKYSFKYNSPSPSKCFEVFQIKKLAMMLSSAPTILKSYIDWVYQNKVMQAKRRLTSISFLTAEETVQYYKINVLLANNSAQNTNITRATLLPENYQQICVQCKMNHIKSYGDLAFLYHAQRTTEIQNIFDQLQLIGFDQDILNKII